MTDIGLRARISAAPPPNAEARFTLVRCAPMMSFCSIDFLNDSEERSRSPVGKFAEEAVAVRECNPPGH